MRHFRTIYWPSERRQRWLPPTCWQAHAPGGLKGRSCTVPPALLTCTNYVQSKHTNESFPFPRFPPKKTEVWLMSVTPPPAPPPVSISSNQLLHLSRAARAPELHAGLKLNSHVPSRLGGGDLKHTQVGRWKIPLICMKEIKLGLRRLISDGNWEGNFFIRSVKTWEKMSHVALFNLLTDEWLVNCCASGLCPFWCKIIFPQISATSSGVQKKKKINRCATQILGLKLIQFVSLAGGGLWIGARRQSRDKHGWRIPCTDDRMTL